MLHSSFPCGDIREIPAAVESKDLVLIKELEKICRTRKALEEQQFKKAHTAKNLNTSPNINNKHFGRASFAPAPRLADRCHGPFLQAGG